MNLTIAVCVAAVALALVLMAPAADAAEFKAKEWHKKMLELVNKERAAAGKPPMCLNLKLIQAAQKHSNWQADKGKMDHSEDPDTPTAELGGRVTLAGLKWSGVAENVAAGQSSIVKVMQSWMDSPGHKANILGDSKFAGFGFQKGKPMGDIPGSYWTQVFASGDDECLP